MFLFEDRKEQPNTFENRDNERGYFVDFMKR